MADDLTFEEKVYQGKFSETYLINLKKDLENQLAKGAILKINIPSAKFKISLITKYLKDKHSKTLTVAGTVSNLPTKTTSKTITLNTTDNPIKGGDSVVTDEAVARKFLQVKDGAKERGIEFSLSLTSVKNLMKAKKCYYSGVAFDYTDPEKSLTFDRVDNKKGYVKGNVVACTKAVNDLKNVLIEHPVSLFKDNVKLLKKVVDKWDLGK